MSSALQSSSKNQSEDTKKNPEAQLQVVKTMSGLARAKKHLTKTSKVWF